MFVATTMLLVVLAATVYAVLDRSSIPADRADRWPAVLIGFSSAALAATLAVAIVQVMR